MAPVRSMQLCSVDLKVCMELSMRYAALQLTQL